VTGSLSDIRCVPLPTDDPKVRRPDITRAREVLGWEATIDLSVGLEATVAYFRGLQDRGALESPPVLTDRDEASAE